MTGGHMGRALRFVAGATTLALLVITAAVVVSVTPTSAGDDVDTRTFNVEGVVLVDDIDESLPGGQGFVLDDPTGPSWVDGARDEQNDLTLKVTPETEYRVYDPDTGTWPRATYEETIVEGAEIRVGGRQYQVGDHYELYANYVWRPVKPTNDRPENPSGEVTDFLFTRTFNALGTVAQLGIRVPTYSGIYCETCGFVVGELVETNNDHVTTVAAAHWDKLPITVTPDTNYYVEENGTKRKGSFEDIAKGIDLRVAGKYGFDINDWRFIATYVWIPDRTNSGGVIEWQTLQKQTDAGSDTSNGVDGTRYDGDNLAGDEEVFPGTTTLALDWSFDSVTNQWTFSGTWDAGDLAGNGSIFGTVDGIWDPATGSIEGDAVITGGTGRHDNVVGQGPVLGTTLPGTSPPPQIPDLYFHLRVTRV
jgi:hypothetical protein